MRSVGYGEGVLTADGCVPAIAELADDVCCPIDICNLDACNLMCSFIELLPSGPLWDRAKAQGMDRYQDQSCSVICPPDPSACNSLVDYAVYSGYRLAGLIQGPLWAAIRESSPYTAVETLDSWLQLYDWTDCWESACKDPRLGPSPFECGVFEPTYQQCDANFSPIYVPEIPEPMNSAVKRAIAIALTRLQMQPIKNLCGINWILEPLGAYLRPREGASVDECCKGLLWEICTLGEGTIEAVPGRLCSDPAPRQIKASFAMPTLSFNIATGRCEPTGPGTVTVWPAVMAAQCIALSLIPSKDCETPILRCAELN